MASSELKIPKAVQALRRDVRFNSPYEMVNSDLTDKELRQVYTQLRDIARKRIQRLEQSRLADAKVVEIAKRRIPELKGLTTRQAVAHQLDEVKRLLLSERFSVQGQRRIQERNRKTLSRYYRIPSEQVTPEQMSDYAEYWQWVKWYGLDLVLDSDQIQRGYVDYSLGDETDVTSFILTYFAEYMEAAAEAKKEMKQYAANKKRARGRGRL